MLAIAGQPVEEGIGRRIVALAQTAQQGRRRREEDEIIKIQRCGELVQQPTTSHFGSEHRDKTFPALVEQNRIIQHPGSVEDPFQRKCARRDLRKEHPHCCFVSHIDQRKLHRDSVRRQLVQDRLLGRIVYPAAAGKDQLFGPLLSQPLGHQQPQRAQATGDQIGSVGVNGNPRLIRGSRLVPHQPCAITLALAIGDLRFTHLVFEQQFGQQGLRGRCRVDVDQATPQLTVLQRNHPPQPPKPGLVYGHRFGGGKLLCVACDHPEPCGFAARHGGEHSEALHQVKDTGQIVFLLCH